MSDLNHYLNYSKYSPLLSNEEERELLNKIREGDSKSKNQLILHNLRLVVFTAKDYRRKNIPLIDLICEGNIGLIEAAKRFDSLKYQNRFSSYAVHWIKQSITKYLMDKSRFIRLPYHVYNSQKNLENLSKEFSINKDKKSLNSNLPNLGWLKNKIKKIELIPFCSSYSDFDNEENEKTLHTPSGVDFTFEDTSKSLLKEGIIKVINDTLTEKEKEIIYLRFGINHKKRYTLQEVGDIYNLTKERIRQIQEKSLEKMSERLINLKGYIDFL